MNAPTLHSARLTLGSASPDHAEAFIAFCATEHARVIGGPHPTGDGHQIMRLRHRGGRS